MHVILYVALNATKYKQKPRSNPTTVSVHKNGHAHYKNLAATAGRLLTSVLPFVGARHYIGLERY